MKEIIDNILESRISVIAYSSSHESHAMSIINMIPNRIDIGVNDVISSSDIQNFFNTLSYKRDYKINYLLGNNVQYIVVNIPNILFDDDDQSDKVYMKKSVFYKGIETMVYQMNNTESDLNYRLIYLTNTYNSPHKNFNIIGGTSIIYSSDFVLSIRENILKVIKDRNGANKEYDIRKEFRDYNIIQLFNEI
jgi:hypothetical protein